MLIFVSRLIHKQILSRNLEFKNKVTKIFIHGFLHLLGHDHIKLKDFKKMNQEEEKIYKFVKIKSGKLA